MPPLSPAFAPTRRPGLSLVPLAERVIALMLRRSTRITSNLRTRLVLVFSTQSLRLSVSRALSFAIATFTFLRRFDARCARELALQSNQPRSLLQRKARHVKHFSSGHGSRHRHAPVDSDNLLVARGGNRIGNGGESDMPPSSAVTRDPIRLHANRHGTRPAEPHPACFWDSDLADIAGDSADIPLPAALTHDAKSLVPSRFPPRRQPMRSPEEVRHGLREVPQCLLLHHLAAVAQPRVFRARCGELSELLKVTWRAIPSRPPVRMLLDRQVPNVPGMSTVLRQNRFLLRSRSHIERGERLLWAGHTVRSSMPHSA